MTYDELRLQQLLGPFNRPQGIATLNPLAFQYQDQSYPDLQSSDVGYSIAPPGSADEGYAIGPYGTPDNFFGTGFSPTSDIGFPSVTRGNLETFQDFYAPVYEPYNEEKDDEQVSYNELTGQLSFGDKVKGILESFSQRPGISSVIGAFNPLAGLITKGIGSLFNRFQPAFQDFRRSESLADFFQTRRDAKAREEARQRGIDKEMARSGTGRDIRASDFGGDFGQRAGGGGFSGTGPSSDVTGTEGSF